METLTRPDKTTGRPASSALSIGEMVAQNGATGPDALREGTNAATEALLTRERERRLAEVRLRSGE